MSLSSTEDDASSRFIPSITALSKAAEELPPADRSKIDACSIEVSKKHSIEFRRVKMRSSHGYRFRWIYEGKVQV